MSKRFEFPDKLRFTCTQCGDCCRSFNLMLGSGERERLEALDWRGREEDLVNEAPAVQLSGSRGQARYRLVRRADGACIFLGKGNQCRIHEHFGAEVKPLMCRLYPFGFYRLGDRITVDVAFSCRAVSQGSGAPVAERVPEWTRLLNESTESGEPRHRLTKKYAIDGELLWELEHHMLELLSGPSMALFDRIRSVLQFNRLATVGDPTTDAARQLRQAMARGIPLQTRRIPFQGTMDRTQQAIFYQWLYLALNPVPGDFDLMLPREQQAEKKRRMAAANRYQNRSRCPFLNNRDMKVSFEEIDRVDAGAFRDWQLETVENFLKAKILSQRFLFAGEMELPLVEATPRFFLCFPMLIWTGKALAAERGASSIEGADVRRAVRLIDRSLGQIDTSQLSRKQARVYSFIVEETDLVACATHDLLNTGK
ncbi:MAG: YkgJ family cysteine cluster protein [Acidobacteriota bacterium]